jgi:hypothetical protein
MTEAEARVALKGRTLIKATKDEQPLDNRVYVPFFCKVRIGDMQNDGKVAFGFSVKDKHLN